MQTEPRRPNSPRLHLTGEQIPRNWKMIIKRQARKLPHGLVAPDNEHDIGGVRSSAEIRQVSADDWRPIGIDSTDLAISKVDQDLKMDDLSRIWLKKTRLDAVPGELGRRHMQH